MKRLLLLLLLAGFAFAASGNNSPPPAPIINIDVSGIINAINALPLGAIVAFFNYLVAGLSSIVSTLTTYTFNFIFSSPDPNWFCAPYSAILAVLDSLFALVLVGMALFFILRSGDVEGRVAAKKWMENMVILAIVLAFSFQIFVMLNSFNTYLTDTLANQSMKSLFGAPSNPNNLVFAAVMLGITDGLGLLTFVTLLLRYILMPFMLLFFPVALFLYFIPPLKGWGLAFLKIILVFVFMTTADALVLVGLSAMFGSSDPNLTDAFVRSLATAFGFGALGLVNIALVLMALLSILVPMGKAVVNSAAVTLARKAVIGV